jgi:hypothetical protein
MSTIKSTNISIDGTTAWLVDTPGMSVGWELRNRPCDTCLGTGFMTLGLSRDTGRPCHCIDGRHTFTLDVECSICNGKRSEFCGYGDGLSDDNPNCSMGLERLTVHVVQLRSTDDENIHVWSASPLPEATAHGMWAVELVVHT